MLSLFYFFLFLNKEIKVNWLKKKSEQTGHFTFFHIRNKKWKKKIQPVSLSLQFPISLLLAAEYSIFFLSAITSTGSHSSRLRADAYPTRQPVTNTTLGWIVRHPCFPLSHFTLLSASCRSCLLSCSFSDRIYPRWAAQLTRLICVWVRLSVSVCIFQASSHGPPDDHLKTRPDQGNHTHMQTHRMSLS